MFEELHKAVAEGDVQRVSRLVTESLDHVPDVRKILEDGLIAGLELVGRQFSENRLFLPEVMMSARAVQAGMEILTDPLSRSGIEPRGSLIIGTVKSDQHDIGKNIVSMMLRGAGFLVKDLGVDVAPERFVQEAQKGGVQIVAMSALLTPSLSWVSRTIEAFEKEAMRPQVKILVGGAAFDEKRAQEMGVDGYAPDAAKAVDEVKVLLRI